MSDTLIVDDVETRCEDVYIQLVYAVESVVSEPFLQLRYSTDWLAESPTGSGCPTIIRGQEFPNGML